MLGGGVGGEMNASAAVETVRGSCRSRDFQANPLEISV